MNLRYYSQISPGYLQTMGIPVVDGRDFAPGDRGSSGTVIIDQEAARRLWPDLASPVGRMIKLGDEHSTAPWYRVIGVARTIEEHPREDIYLRPDPDVYVVRGIDSSTSRTLVVRGDDATWLAVAVRHELQSAATELSFGGVQPWLASFRERVATSAFIAWLFSAFGLFALGLCGVGIYGVLAYSVNQRLREFAVRLSLGARRRDLVRHVLHDAAVMALAGVGIGALVIIAVIPKFGVPAGGHYALAASLTAAEALLLLVAIVAAIDPVRRAVRADLVELLRAN
jgi:putative ABC transport system permease protein